MLIFVCVSLYGLLLSEALTLSVGFAVAIIFEQFYGAAAAELTLLCHAQGEGVVLVVQVWVLDFIVEKAVCSPAVLRETVILV